MPNEPVFRAAPVARTHAELGESPLWDAEAGLRWLDIAGRRLLTLSLDGAETSISLSRTVTAIELGLDQELLAITSRGFGWLNVTTGRVETIVNTLNDNTITMNDGAIDARGRAWAGSAVRDQTFRGKLFRLEGHQISEHLGKIGMSNGIDWSPDSRVLYHVDSAAGTVTAWEYDTETGELTVPQLLRSVSPNVGLPDGLTVDANGDVWLAIWGAGQVWRIAPDTGRTTAVVKVPTPCTTSCAFGGPSLSTLFISTANHEASEGSGLMYGVEVPANGMHPHRFLGSRL